MDRHLERSNASPSSARRPNSPPPERPKSPRHCRRCHMGQIAAAVGITHARRPQTAPAPRSRHRRHPARTAPPEKLNQILELHRSPDTLPNREPLPKFNNESDVLSAGHGRSNSGVSRGTDRWTEPPALTCSHAMTLNSSWLAIPPEKELWAGAELLTASDERHLIVVGSSAGCRFGDPGYALRQ